ncbi:hypothetical protein HO173_010831 [Letharia columbiana]|uniref:Tyrosinase copper-binding domain-containing protein n=1 Tax=Letharia columbiana TaxID=112416 RepID=A0A8H6L0G3_9LECA|nr:uncharacterized protein HO173_010831 [Letharia columbiana]KAF6230923.1 hypothetical protein HO173_010831 [Letharia columbiana]
MMQYSQSTAAYAPVVDLEFADDKADKNPQSSVNDAHRSRVLRLSLALCVAVLCTVLGFGGGILFKQEIDSNSLPSTACTNPIIRREWRDLSDAEKNDYIEAVQCLRSSPSKLGLNQTLYDDFPYVHSRNGEASHDTAAFLPWHRYFIHVYEKALREQCAYAGHLTYWDWSLDWEDVTHAPVWDTTLGFGGDGNEKDIESIHGHCVTDGPFARLQVLYVEKFPYPHCLSRGFATGGNLTRFSAALEPTALNELLRTSDYATFNLGVEDGPHLSIPRSIHGDFSTVTAPADPVFFLHHTQLDRLWWKWQQGDTQARLKDYSGKAAYTSSSEASLRDPLPLGYLAPDVRVEDIMNTESGLVCYRY